MSKTEDAPTDHERQVQAARQRAARLRAEATARSACLRSCKAARFENRR